MHQTEQKCTNSNFIKILKININNRLPGHLHVSGFSNYEQIIDYHLR